MGICSSADNKANREAQAKNAAIDRKLQQDASNSQHIHKLLLLGAGESGKSTLFKQMKQLYGEEKFAGGGDEYKNEYVTNIANNIIESIQLLIPQVETNYGGWESAEAKEASKPILELKRYDHPITEAEGKQISALWADPGMKRAMADRSSFQLVEGAEYFFDHIERIASPKYEVSYEDFLRTRVRTTGIVQEEFEISNNRFQVYDMGGQRSERKKWMNCFEGVTAVIFVSAISAFDQVLFEDNRTNRVKESLFLFKDICNAKWFVQTAMIIFLNKKDIFTKKLEAGKSIKSCFPDYQGPDTVEASIEYVQQQFQNQSHVNSQKIFIHTTVATDQRNVTVVFEAVKDIVINRAVNGGDSP